ncbi:hypothetical protein BDR22DRAFT_888281 [Usnea florida]
MSWLLYPLVKFGIILYNNELPGRPRAAGADYPENTGDARRGSTPETSAPKTATLAIPSITPHSTVVQTTEVVVSQFDVPEPAASATMKEVSVHGHHVHFERPIADDQKRTITETMAQRTSLSAQVRAHRLARRQIQFLRATILTREEQLTAIRDRRIQIADMQHHLRNRDHRPCIDPRLFRLSCVDPRLRS